MMMMMTTMMMMQDTDITDADASLTTYTKLATWPNQSEKSVLSDNNTL